MPQCFCSKCRNRLALRNGVLPKALSSIVSIPFSSGCRADLHTRLRRSKSMTTLSSESWNGDTSRTADAGRVSPLEYMVSIHKKLDEASRMHSSNCRSALPRPISPAQQPRQLHNLMSSFTRQHGSKKLPATSDRWAVYATSDIHTDFKKNMECIKRWPNYGPKTALIVAGDVATNMTTIEETLRELKCRFQEVFYCPGNHDLWCLDGKEPWSSHLRGGLNSVNKMIALIDLCTSIGVRVAPTRLCQTGAYGMNERTEEPSQVEIFPLFSWYKTIFFGNKGPMSSQEKTFDQACIWPEGVGCQSQPNNSLLESIADFMLQLNEPAIVSRRGRTKSTPSCLEEFLPFPDYPGGTFDDALPPPPVISFSHFIPWPELYHGNPFLKKVMGCEELGVQVEKLQSSVHVFGHSHLNLDKMRNGTRYLQAALGYPNDRSDSDPLPQKCWPPDEPEDGPMAKYTAHPMKPSPPCHGLMGIPMTGVWQKKPLDLAKGDYLTTTKCQPIPAGLRARCANSPRFLPTSGAASSPPKTTSFFPL
mmetsp:Transcript_8368/g.11291  ORF Transcript_8368/g.11291 Transcript_8368/m.11291 type:complete len:533 (+) Transcript_8368:122-1720(+)|eukprot:CAMPEP_0196570542 /NCGR_PEP_ID=MMETSP1081-20130531/657_1 /TAXON_ID=36882 /ORGANISM="Pyramimonas amylifera, Strain CCMP720" /LENGTH=532 /DNA_ID=CAMNT_0041887045 /DNA_START=121 /DNA_END=1719 /DNA_ORIENTATION=-